MDTAPETHLDKLPSRISTSENVVDRASAWAELSSDSLLAIHCRVLDMMAEGVTVSDEDGIIQYTNAAEDEMFGYNRGELLGRAVGVQNAGEVDGARPLQTAGAWRGEQLNRKKDGTLFATRARISSLEVSGKHYQVCLHEDITERRRSESELRSANESLSALITASPLPIAAFGRDGLITLWNPAAERVFGWTAAEVLGKPLPFIPAEKADEHRSMRERDLMGDNFANREVRRHRKDGTPIDITVSTAPMRDDSGQITGIMSVYVDITEQKKHAEDQRRSLEMLRMIERQLMLLVDASGTLLASPESAHVLETIIRLAQQFIDAEAYAVWRKNADAWELVASAGLSATYERTVLRNNESTRVVPYRAAADRERRNLRISAAPAAAVSRRGNSIDAQHSSTHSWRGWRYDRLLLPDSAHLHRCGNTCRGRARESGGFSFGYGGTVWASDRVASEG